MIARSSRSQVNGSLQQLDGNVGLPDKRNFGSLSKKPLGGIGLDVTQGHTDEVKERP